MDDYDEELEYTNNLHHIADFMWYKKMMINNFGFMIVGFLIKLYNYALYIMNIKIKKY